MTDALIEISHAMHGEAPISRVTFGRRLEGLNSEILVLQHLACDVLDERRPPDIEVPGIDMRDSMSDGGRSR